MYKIYYSKSYLACERKSTHACIDSANAEKTIF